MTIEEGVPHPLLPQPGAGEVITACVDREDVVLVGTVPSGYTAILCPAGWAALRRWKLTTLRVSKGSPYAAGEGRAGGFLAARFLINPSPRHIVRHRNGNPFDIRLSNIVSVPRPPRRARQCSVDTSGMGPG